MAAADDLWAIILAAGEGSRLLGLTRALYGKPLPKQFACFSDDDRSLVQTAVEDIQPLVPNERILVVVPSVHLALAEQQLSRYEGVTLVAQPENRGSAPSLVLPLSRLLDKNSAASVVILPAAYALKQRELLLESIQRARQHLNSAPITLLGVTDGTGHDGSCMVPGRQIVPGIHAISDFVVAPREQVAKILVAKGGLWDTGCLVADAAAIWRVSSRHLRAHCEIIRQGVIDRTASAMSRAFQSLESADLAKHVIAKQLGIAVTDVTESGFAAIATPEQALAAFPDLRQRSEPAMLGAATKSHAAETLGTRIAWRPHQ